MDIKKIKEKIESGDIEGAKSMIESRSDRINLRDSNGKTYLMAASAEGNIVLINLLIDAGADLDKRDTRGRTAFYHAVFGHQLQAVTILLSRGSDVERKDTNGFTLLHLAAGRGHEWKDVVAALLQTKGETAIEVNQRDNSFGATPLHFACFQGHTDTVRLLLNHDGIDANAMDKDGDTPLHLAVRKRHHDVVTLMLSQDAVKLDKKNHKEMTPLLETVSQGHLGMMHKLIDRGASINVVDGEGNSCLHLAVKNDMFDSEGITMDILDEYCNELDLRKEERLSGTVVARYLAGQGADFYYKNDKNNTPLDLIKNSNLREKLQTFLPPVCLRCRNRTATIKYHPCEHLLISKQCSIVPLQRCLKCRKLVTSKSEVETAKVETKEVRTVTKRVESPKFKEKGVQTVAEPFDSQKLEEKDLLKVALRLGGEWWKVGIFLDIKTSELEIIKRDNSNDIVEQSYQMMYKWFTSCDPKRRTAETIKAALEEAECYNALECLSLDKN
ncbi:E3 ubiquitin-protein ligase MIB2-like isoform X3 [Octopus sinensis]|uniref:E3 ubiquitin-protein ligase MIB2-like isoform X3 n=1 Tax=Octopus sinensis TaxID=2607531 RepID=A0A7E6EIM9_9MOLL|nr:E3 ubiquitin-protein ligase MIB2-like isoform X3 [Octopus sinensis]